MGKTELGAAGEAAAFPANDAAAAASNKPSRQAYYALALLVLVNFFNLVDRNVMSIVGQSVKADLHLTDVQLGFLMGTAFAVLYGVTGVAMGRISDALNRSRLMAAALALWCGLTALSGLATSFVWLAAARIGVGVGESAASPCSQALLTEYFPPRNRAAALGFYMVGVYLGAAGSLVLGAVVLQHWGAICTALPGAACRIASWRAAFFVVGAPGLLLAALLYRLPDVRARPIQAEASAPRVFVRELSAAVPPFTLFNLHGAGGVGAVGRNLALAAAVAAIACGLGLATGDWPQWIALGVGGYSILTWGEVMRLRDPPLHRLTFGCPSFTLVVLGGALLSCYNSAVGAWSAPYVMRTLGARPAAVGFYLGGATALAAALSASVGGWLVDRWRRRDVRGPLWVGIIALVGSAPLLGLLLRAPDVRTYACVLFFFILVTNCWVGGFAALLQDLVLPRMRGAAAACLSLVTVLVGAGLGPYWVGKISQVTGSLALGLLSMLAVVPVAVILLLFAARGLSKETADRRLGHALAAGEPPHP